MIKILVILTLIKLIHYTLNYKKNQVKKVLVKRDTRSLVMTQEKNRRDARGRFIENAFISWAGIRKNNNLNY